MSTSQISEPGPWLSYRGLTARYGLSESTIRRLIKLGLWPAARQVTKGRVVFDQRTCDRAIQKLLSRRVPVVTTPPSASSLTA